MKPENFKSSTVLNILHRERLAGKLRRTERGASFEYDTNYLDDSRYEGIAFHLPKSAAAYETTGVNLHPFFAGLLPEGLRLKAMIQELKTSPDDLFTLFAALESRGVGDVLPQGSRPTLPSTLPPKNSAILFEDFFHEQLQNVLKNRTGNDSFAGVQDKISASMINIPVNIAKKTHAYILKLNNRDYPTITANEYACLQLARSCGINVVQAKIVKDAGSNEGLLVQRFDRVWNPSKNGMDQIHTEDACQFLNLYPSEKYRVSLNKIAEAIQRWSPAREIDILNLIEQYAFSYLVCNGDMHAKNISLMRDYPSGRISLAPGYDIVCTLLYGDTKMALKIDGRDDNIKGKMLMQFGHRYGVSEKLIKDRCRKLTLKFNKKLPQFLNAISEVIQNPRKLGHLEKIIKKRLRDLDS